MWLITERGESTFPDFALIARPRFHLRSLCCLSPRCNPPPPPPSPPPHSWPVHHQSKQSSGLPWKKVHRCCRHRQKEGRWRWDRQTFTGPQVCSSSHPSMLVAWSGMHWFIGQISISADIPSVDWQWFMLSPSLQGFWSSFSKRKEDFL